jgi:hypothetical protein
MSATMSLVRRRFLAVVAATLAPVSRAARAAPAGEPALRIGVSLSTSGHLAAFGEMQAKGYRLWERDVNAQGGILGRKVEVDIRDDGSSADKARALYTELIQRDRVHFVFGPYSSGSPWPWRRSPSSMDTRCCRPAAPATRSGSRAFAASSASRPRPAASAWAFSRCWPRPS